MLKYAGVFVATIGLVFFVLYSITAFTQGFAVPCLWLWLAGGLILITAGIILVRKFDKPKKKSTRVLLTTIFVLLCVVCTFIEGTVVLSMKTNAPEGVDYVIVLGCRVNGTAPSEALSYRISAAADYLLKNPSSKCVATGAVGSNADISEAECIKNGLIERGVEADRILIEDRSTSTVENIRFAYEIIGDKGKTVAVLTNNFHIFRGVKIAKKLGDYKIFSISAPFASFRMPFYMLREIATFVKDLFQGNI